MNFDKITESNIDCNTSNKLTNMLEYYKSLSFKLILSSESTFYKISSDKKVLSNVKTEEAKEYIGMFINKLFVCLLQGDLDDDISSNIQGIAGLCEDDRIVILKKVFWIIYKKGLPTVTSGTPVFPG